MSARRDRCSTRVSMLAEMVGFASASWPARWLARSSPSTMRARMRYCGSVSPVRVPSRIRASQGERQHVAVEALHRRHSRSVANSSVDRTVLPLLCTRPRCSSAKRVVGRLAGLAFWARSRRAEGEVRGAGLPSGDHDDQRSDRQAPMTHGTIWAVPRMAGLTGVLVRIQSCQRSFGLSFEAM